LVKRPVLQALRFTFFKKSGLSDRGGFTAVTFQAMTAPNGFRALGILARVRSPLRASAIRFRAAITLP